MAAAVATISITQPPDNSQRLIHVFGTVAIGADPLTYGAGGIVMTFAGQDLIKSNEVPLKVDVRSAKASGGTGLYVYSFCPGTTMVNGKLQVFTGAAAQSPLAELADGVVPAGVSADTIIFDAWFIRL